MILVPVVERELRVASRRAGTYWNRFFSAALAIGMTAWIWYAMGDSAPRGAVSKTLFYSMSVLCLVYGLTAGITITADCLSEEKREGTLGLLFLTDLRGYDVVLGKLAATSLNSFYRLLSVFPVLAVPLLLGGLTPGEFWRMILVLMNVLFLSLSAGMLASAISYHERKAMGAALLLILAVAAVPPVAGLAVASQTVLFNYDVRYLIPSPAYAFYMSMDGHYQRQPWHYQLSMGLTHGVSWLYLAGSAWVVRRAWQDRPAGGRKAAWLLLLDRLKFGGELARRAFRNRLLEVNPVFWLSSRHRAKPYYVLGLLVLVGVIWGWLSWKYGNEMFDPAIYITTALTLHTLLKLWIASESCQRLSEDRRSGALELLLSTPLSVGEILWGQLLAVRRQFGAAIVIVLVADVVMFVAELRDGLADSMEDWVLVSLAGVLMFLADACTLVWVSMWLALTAKKSNVAASGAVFRVLVLPWILFAGLLTAGAFIDAARLSEPENYALGAWFVIGILNDVFFFTWARTHLHTQMRTLATERFDLKRGQGWFRKLRSAKD